MSISTAHSQVRSSTFRQNSFWGRSVLAWPAWMRVLLVLPALIGLWFAVWWAQMEIVAP